MCVCIMSLTVGSLLRRGLTAGPRWIVVLLAWALIIGPSASAQPQEASGKQVNRPSESRDGFLKIS